jgi:hypothetical protein
LQLGQGKVAENRGGTIEASNSRTVSEPKSDRRNDLLITYSHRRSMSMPSVVLFSLLAAFVCGLVWALYSLASTHSLSSFVILCTLTFAIMTTAGYAVDQWEGPSRQ